MTTVIDHFADNVLVQLFGETEVFLNQHCLNIDEQHNEIHNGAWEYKEYNLETC